MTSTKVPVQADKIDWGVVIAGEIAANCPAEQPEQHKNTDQDVDSVQTRHHEIKAEEDELVAGWIFRIREEPPRQQTVVELVRILHILHDEEYTSAKNGDREVRDQLLLFVRGGFVHSHDHRETGDQQDNRVQRAQRYLKMFVALEERFRESRLHVGESGKKTAEHQNFSSQERPHTNFGGIELLFLW